jgi:hypothetical protein
MRVYPVVVDERLLVDVCFQHVLVGAKEVDHWMRLRDEHKPLALDVEHAVRLEVQGGVLGVLLAPGHAFGGSGVVLVDGERMVVCVFGESHERVCLACASDLTAGDTRDAHADGAGHRVAVLDDSGLLENSL